MLCVIPRLLSFPPPLSKPADVLTDTANDAVCSCCRCSCEFPPLPPADLPLCLTLSIGSCMHDLPLRKLIGGRPAGKLMLCPGRQPVNSG